MATMNSTAVVNTTEVVGKVIILYKNKKVVDLQRN